MQGREPARYFICAFSGLAFLSAGASMAWAGGAPPGGQTLVFGTRANERDQLASDLSSLGYSVVNSATLPSDLSPFNVIWNISFSPLSAMQQSQLVAFVASGHGLHLSGEQMGNDSLNNSLAGVINALVSGGGVNVGITGQQPFALFAFNSTAVQEVSSSPNALSGWNALVPGGMSGNISGANILATSSNGKIVGGAWDGGSLSGGLGRLSILMDGDWLLESGELPVVQNLQKFLSTPEPGSLLLLAAAIVTLPRRRRTGTSLLSGGFPFHGTDGNHQDRAVGVLQNGLAD